MKAKLTNLLIAILVLADPIHGQLNYDQGLWKACNQTGTPGGFRMRSAHDSTEGDKCTLAFHVAVSNQEDADQFCRLYAPWRLVKAQIENKDRPRVLCHVEATLACKNGWIQMFGYCFRMPDEHKAVTFPEAQAMCKAFEGGAIASLRHKYIIGSWRRYFRGVGQIWVDASETWHKFIQKTGTVDGDAFAIAFTGKHYDFSVPPNALIKIDPNIKLKVLCEYKPAMTAAEINYLGRRYSEIYYPSVKVPSGILVRSASSYTTSTKNLEVCQKALKPYNVDVEEVGPFVADDATLLEIHATNLPFTLLTRSGARARTEDKHMKHPNCFTSGTGVSNRFEVEVPESNAGNYVLNVTEEITCDNMKSAAIVHDKNAATLKIMSDSRSLPIWCKLGKKIKFTHIVPEKYTLFDRANGEAVAHRIFLEKVTFEEAKKKCRDDDGFLSGVNDLKEANALGELARLAGLNNEAIWLGGRRKESCHEVETDFNSDKGECSRNRVIQWQDDVAQDFYTDWWRNGADLHQNPSSKPNQQQLCLSYVQGKPSWADSNMQAFLDDVECYSKKPFFCTKKVVVSKANE